MKRYMVIAILLTAWVPGFTQESEIRIGYAGLDESGSESGFANHYNFSDGLFLEMLDLDLSSQVKSVDKFEIKASGFGADPYSKASLKVERKGAWLLDLNFQRREMRFTDAQFNSGANSDDWSISRIKARFAYDKLKTLRLELRARETLRDGTVARPFYGLGLPYVVERDLDETMREIAFSLETKTLPLKLFLEQSLASYERTYRTTPGGSGSAVNGTDPDVLTELNRPGKESNDAPATRLSATWRNERFEFLAHGLMRRDRLDSDRSDATTYAIDGGAIGNISYLYDTQGTADRDTTLADLRLGFLATDQITIRVAGAYHDRTTETGLNGRETVVIAGREAPLEFAQDLDNKGFMDQTDQEMSLEAEWRVKGFSLTAAFKDLERDVAWQRENESLSFNETRNSDTWLVTAWWRPNSKTTARLGYENGSFSRYLFRTHPETVERLWLKLKFKPVKGLSLNFHYTGEQADNPQEIANLDRELTTLGASMVFTSEKGLMMTLLANQLDLSSSVDTLFFGPDPTTGLSFYDTQVLTLSGSLVWPITEKIRLNGSLTNLEDSGDSLPLSQLYGHCRLEISGPRNTELHLFAQTWSFDMDHRDDVDYDATRYGLSIGMRF